MTMTNGIEREYTHVLLHRHTHGRPQRPARRLWHQHDEDQQRNLKGLIYFLFMWWQRMQRIRSYAGYIL